MVLKKLCITLVPALFMKHNSIAIQNIIHLLTTQNMTYAKSFTNIKTIEDHDYLAMLAKAHHLPVRSDLFDTVETTKTKELSTDHTRSDIARVDAYLDLSTYWLTVAVSAHQNKVADLYASAQRKAQKCQRKASNLLEHDDQSRQKPSKPSQQRRKRMGKDRKHNETMVHRVMYLSIC